MVTSKRVSYTVEQSKRVIDLFTAYPNDKTINALALELGKTKKSVTQKLVIAGLYKAQPYTTKQGGVPISKDNQAQQITTLLNIQDLASINSLARANKNVLKILLSKLIT